jgi:peptide/nickel transport system substrate-binding protein
MRTMGRRVLGRPLTSCMLAGAVALSVAACGGSGNNNSSGGSSSGGGSSSSSSGGAGNSGGIYGTLPKVGGTPVKGGTLTFGQLSGSTPTWIFPITPAANASVYGAYPFINQMWLPLYNGPAGGTPAIDQSISLAQLPVYSDGGKTVTINMKQGYKWSDGKPVDANDVVFDIDLIKAAVKESPANEEAYTPGLFPDNVVSMSTKGKYTVVLHLNKKYNPSFFTNDQIEGVVIPIPSTAWNLSAPGKHLSYNTPANAKKIYDFLAKDGGKPATFQTNPLWKDADGPFKISKFSATNGSYTLVDNPSFGGTPKPYVSAFQGVTFTGLTAQLNAERTGSVDIAGVDFSQLGNVPELKSAGNSVFGAPNLGWFGAFLNFKDQTNHINKVFAQPYARQALAHLEDQPAYLKGIYKNAGVLAYGPVPSAPKTPYTPSDAITAPYPYSISTAISLLKSHGWKVVPNGTDTCAKPGTGAGECGAGIPKGTPFSFTWFALPASETPSSSLESEAYESSAKQAGIKITLKQKLFNFIVQNYNDADPADKKYDNDWGVINFGGYTDDYYPTQNSLFNTAGSYNQGAYSDPTANKDIQASVYSSNPNAVTNEASYLTKSVPALFMPNSDLIIDVNNKVHAASSRAFLPLTQYTPFGQYFWLSK